MASEGFDDHVYELHETVGDNKKALVIFNAHDYTAETDRLNEATRKRKLFERHGFEFIELDLRDYFGKNTSS